MGDKIPHRPSVESRNSVESTCLSAGHCSPQPELPMPYNLTDLQHSTARGATARGNQGVVRADYFERGAVNLHHHAVLEIVCGHIAAGAHALRLPPVLSSLWMQGHGPTSAAKPRHLTIALDRGAKLM